MSTQTKEVAAAATESALGVVLIGPIANAKLFVVDQKVVTMPGIKMFETEATEAWGSPRRTFGGFKSKLQS